MIDFGYNILEMIQELQECKTDREQLEYKVISRRLDQSFDSYYTDLVHGYDFLKQRKPTRLLRELNKNVDS